MCIDCHHRPAEAGTDTCFHCRVATIGYGWRGGGFGYGRANFSARTNEEFLNEHVGDVKARLRSGEISPLRDFVA